jgi:hypothetical protein
MLFNLNGIFITTHFETIENMGFSIQHRQRPPIPFCILVLRPRLKELLEQCMKQFIKYIKYVTQCQNVYNYLDKIQ